MIIAKTEQFNKQFLYDLADLAIFKHEYLESIRRWDKEGKLFSIGYGKQPSKTVKFFGSYFDKKSGSLITDIDVILLIDNVRDNRFYLRLNGILRNLDRTPFQFVRFYCGYIDGLEPPWKIGDEGDCSFDIQKVEKWLKNVKKKYPNVYEKLVPYLVKDTISMADLLAADSVIEPYISLTWTREEIIQGHKTYNGVVYNFRTAMETYTRYRVMKFLYTHNGQYCLVDLNFVTRDGSIPRSSKDPVSYYTNNLYKKFKYLKKMLHPEKLQEYFEERKKAIGHITPLAAIVELVNKLKKYNVISPQKLAEMENSARKYAQTNNIDTIDYDELQDIIVAKITPLYEKYSKFIHAKFKLNMYVLDIRTNQANLQVPKTVLLERQKLGYDCPLFPVDVKHIKCIYEKAENILLDPYKLYHCLYNTWINSSLLFAWIIENIFLPVKYRIVKREKKYILFLDNVKISVSSSLQKLQRKALMG